MKYPRLLNARVVVSAKDNPSRRVIERKGEKKLFWHCIANRSPLSSWDMITRGMATAANNFRNDNIFINFHLTKRRGEICKEVRSAKKEGKVKNYEIDANGRIFVRYSGNVNKAFEIINMEDIEKYFLGVKS